MSQFSLPGYDILEKTAEGGMATIWKARQVSLDRIVAIKVLTPSLLDDPEAIERFQREAQAAARLSHPGLIQVYDAGQADNAVFYVMEYVPGRPLGEVLASHGRFSEENALALAECVADALKYAWDRARVVHCDIKPDNIIVERDGSIRVADLGLARVTGQRTEKTENVLGTPNYVSPEQAQGQPDLDCRSDIYSLGATLYHLVTGRLPFASSPGSASMDRHITDYLDDPCDVEPSVSPAFALFLEKLMVKNRERRVSDWSDVLADLAELKEGHPPLAPHPEPGESTVRRGGRRAKSPAPARPEKPQAKKILVSKSQLARPRPGARAGRPALASALVPLAAWALLAGAIYAVIAARVPRGQAVSVAREVIAMPAPAPPVAVADGPDAGIEEDVSFDDTAYMDDAPPEVKTWDDPVFVEGAKIFNAALKDYEVFRKSRTNPESLTQVEARCREAVRLFESCKSRAPAGFAIDRHIGDAYRLMADARQMMRVTADKSP